MEYLYLITVALFLVALGIYFFRRSAARKRSVVRPPRLPRISRQLSADEREAMLAAARSMARDEPEKTAAVLRQWLAVETPPENQTKDRK